MASPAAPAQDSAASDPGAADPVTAAAEARIREAFPDAIEEAVLTGRHPFLVVKAARLRDVARLVRDHADLRYDCCHLISGVDRPAEKRLEAVYHLVTYARAPDAAYKKRAVKNDAWLCLKVRVPRDRAEVPTVADLWTGADWHERETWDLVGIKFTGRAELRRILLPEDWPGHPLRKDWEYPAAYHGVPIVPPEAQ
jgi:NADH-quinone oxidoreductase subunit C